MSYSTKAEVCVKYGKALAKHQQEMASWKILQLAEQETMQVHENV